MVKQCIQRQAYVEGGTEDLLKEPSPWVFAVTGQEMDNIL